MYVAWNNTGDDGAKAIASALENNTTLQTLGKYKQNEQAESTVSSLMSYESMMRLYHS